MDYMNKKEFVVIVTTNSFWTIHKIQFMRAFNLTGRLKFVPLFAISYFFHNPCKLQYS